MSKGGYSARVVLSDGEYELGPHGRWVKVPPSQSYEPVADDPGWNRRNVGCGIALGVPIGLMIAFDVATFFWWTLLVLIILGLVLLGGWKAAELIEEHRRR